MQRKLYQPILQDVIDYLLTFKFVCDVCHHSKWTIYMEQDEKVTVGALNRLIEEPNAPDGDFHLEFNETCTPVIQVQCKHCGQVKLFALPHVLNAIEKQKRDKNEC